MGFSTVHGTFFVLWDRRIFESGNERDDAWDGEVTEVEVFLRINLLRLLGFPFLLWFGLVWVAGKAGVGFGNP